MAACVMSANVTRAALQPCLGTATAADTAHPEVTDLFNNSFPQSGTGQYSTVRYDSKW